MVLFPAPGSPVNQMTAGGTRCFPQGSRSHRRSWAQKSAIFETNSIPPTARESTRRRVKRKTSAEVTSVPKIRQESALSTERAWLSRNIVREAPGAERPPLLQERPEPVHVLRFGRRFAERQVEGQVGRQAIAEPRRDDPVRGGGGADEIEVPAGELLGGHQKDHPRVEEELGDLGEPPHVLGTVLGGPAQVRVHAVEDVRHAEVVDHVPRLEETGFERLGEVLPFHFPRTGEEEQRGMLPVPLG